MGQHNVTYTGREFIIVSERKSTVTLPPPVLWEFGASQRTARKVNTAQLCTRWRSSPVTPTSSSPRSAGRAVPNPARQSGARRTTPGAPLGTRRAGPSWRNGVFTFLAERLYHPQPGSRHAPRITSPKIPRATFKLTGTWKKCEVTVWKLVITPLLVFCSG